MSVHRFLNPHMDRLYRKRATPLDTLLKAWGQAPEVARAAFWQTISEQYATAPAAAERAGAL